MEDDNLRQVLAVLIAIIVLAVAVLGIFLPPLLNPSPIKTPIALLPTSTPTDTPPPATPTSTGPAMATRAPGAASPAQTAALNAPSVTPTSWLNTRAASPTPSPSASPTPTSSPTPTPSATPSPTPSATPTPTDTATPLLATSVSPSPTPRRVATLVDRPNSPLGADLCAGPAGYRMALLTQQPALRPPAGSQLSAGDEVVTAVWQLQNVGTCAWTEAALVAPSGSATPAWARPLLVQLDGSPLGRVEPRQQFRAVLRLKAQEVVGRKLDWSWDVQVRTAYGAWLRQESPLRLVVSQPWVLLASPPEPPRLVKPSPAQEQQTFAGEETYTGYDADILFKWEQDGRPLAPDEYYVLAITHRAGVEYRWVGKATEYRPLASPQGTLGWLVDYADAAGRLRWRVLVVRRTDPNAPQVYSPDDPLVTQSQEGTFRWVKPAPPERRDKGEGPSGGIE